MHINTVPLYSLPQEMIIEIIDETEIIDLTVFAQVDKAGKNLATEALFRQAQAYGYGEKRSDLARNYFIDLLREIKSIDNEQLENCVVYTKRKIYNRVNKYIHIEKTMQALAIDGFNAPFCMQSYLDVPKICNYVVNCAWVGPLASLKENFINVIYNSPKDFLDSTVAADNIKLMKFLLQLRAFSNIQTAKGKTPLYGACRKSNLSMVRLLLKHGAHPHATTLSSHTALTVNTSNHKITKLLLEAGADVNHQTHKLLTALHYAAKQRQFQTARVLLKYGADPNLKDAKGKTSLYRACRNLSRKYAENELRLVKLLLKYKADPNLAAQSGFTPLSISTANYKVTKLLLKAGAYIDHINAEQCSALFIAAYKGHTLTVKTLLKHGANPNLTRFCSLSPLMVGLDDTEITRLLLQYGAEVDYQDKHTGQSALFLAVDKGWESAAQFLLEYGASPNLIDTSGQTPLTLNVKNSNITSLLLQYGAHVHYKFIGQTALDFALAEHKIKTIKVLLEHDAPIQLKTSKILLEQFMSKFYIKSDSAEASTK